MTNPVEDHKEERIDLPSASRKRSGWSKELLDWVKSLAIAFVIVFFINHFAFNFPIVEGKSMEPTLENRERLLLNKLVYRFDDPKRGDVVILEDPRQESNIHLVKRIVALPGDTVEVYGKQLFVNGELVKEPYTDSLIEDGDYGPYTVPEHHYFVMGDNRHLYGSIDSRTFHGVPESMILGRAEAIVWPITKWGGL